MEEEDDWEDKTNESGEDKLELRRMEEEDKRKDKMNGTGR